MENIENYNYEEDFYKKFEEERKKYKRPNILICGYTGSGKTSIIQSLLGTDLVPADKIGAGLPVTQDYEMYENELVRVWDSQGLEPDKGEDEFISRTKKFIREIQERPNVDDHIHIFWYVVSAGITKITPTDLKIMEVFPKESRIVIISKNDIARSNVIKAMKDVLINKGHIPENKIICTTDIEAGRKGIKELYELSLQILPEAYKTAFEEAQRIDIEKAIQKIQEKKPQALTIIGGATAGAAAIAANPIPFSDAVIITPLQVGMIAGLAALYNLNKEQLQHLALPLVARTVGVIAASSLAKLIPGAGNIVNASVAAAITGALGWFVQDQFEKIAIAKVKGETPPVINFDFALFMEFFKQYQKNNK
ncbi:GTPase [Brachyspira pulli]|uniref:GTPase n=1 Tax=Brachyspira pulli TaxID=310721 RepID=UPI0030045DE4